MVKMEGYGFPIIDFYKKKTREICARLEAEEKLKKKELLLNSNNNNFITKNVKMLKLQRPNSAAKINNNFRTQSGYKSKLTKSSKLSTSAKPYDYKIEQTESVLNMLFPYVNENDFKIEPFKSGADIRKEYLKKRQFTPVVKVNLERRKKCRKNRKCKKYKKCFKNRRKNGNKRNSIKKCG